MAAVELFHKDFGGDGSPLVILHGLFGSHKNWTQVGQSLSAVAHVFGLDLRNHGESPHADTHRLTDLLSDLELWLENHAIESPLVLGHSMGGLLAMAYALKHPKKLRALAIVDIAPRAYTPRHAHEFAALSVDVSQAASREEVQALMAEHVRDEQTRRFLGMNLAKTEKGYRWKVNAPVLQHAAYLEEFDASGKSWSGPTIFFVGGRSDYVRPEDEDLIRRVFPNVDLQKNDRADHWLHYSAADWFLPKMTEFVRRFAG